MAEMKTKLNTEEMAKAGVNFGHNVSRLHPKMKGYVAGIKNNVYLINLEETLKELERALNFISKLVSENGTILFVGTKVQMRELVKETAKTCSMPYVTERWLGGTFTNFGTILNRVDYFKDLESKKAQGYFEKRTKKERIKIDKEIELLKNKFEGIRNMSKLPEAVLILDLKKDLTCVNEAKKKGVKIIGVVDTNVNPDLANYPIPANDDAISSIKYILEKIQATILNSK